MATPFWIQSLRKAIMGRRSKPRNRQSPRQFRPSVLVLEDRVMPSAYVVTTTADSGPGSLRDAITQINADTSHTLYASPSNSSVDEIDFAITAASDTGGGFNAGTGVATIAPLSGLASITNSVLINGYTQAGAKMNDLSGPGQLGAAPADPSTYGDDAVLKIELAGVSAGTAKGLDVRTNNVTVQGLVINRFSNGGIGIEGPGNDLIQGNFLGTDVTGKQTLGNTNADVNDNFAYNVTIGGTTPMARNVISGQLPGTDQFEGGIVLYGANNSTVQGNFIGTDVTGTKSLSNAAEGIYIDSNNALIGGSIAGAGNLISGNADNGVIDQNCVGTAFEGNFIGTDVTGTQYLGNSGLGIFGLNGPDTYGGPGAGNLISGNAQGGIRFYGNNNVFQGNLIGTDVTGTNSVGNGGFGILDQDSGDNNLIGGTASGDRNVISGNYGGIELGGAGSISGNVIEGNYIGTDITGTKAIGDHQGGIGLGDGATNNIIGGVNAAARNIISASDTGIGIRPNNAGRTLPSGNVIEGNYLGTDVSGTYALGNRVGISILGSSSNVIGGTAPGAGNLIMGSTSDGVEIGSVDLYVEVVGESGNLILGNSIHDNGGLGIYGPSNAPLLTSAISSVTGTVIAGTLASSPSTSFRVEFFSNPTTAAGEGQTVVGFAQLTTDTGGNFTANLPTELPPGTFLSATATDGIHDTTEFAADIIVKAGSMVTVTWTDGTSTTYDGKQHGATAIWASTGIDNQSGPLMVSYYAASDLIHVLPGAPTNAGAYVAVATFGGDALHIGSSNVADFTINKATLPVLVTSDLMLAGKTGCDEHDEDNHRDPSVAPPPLTGTLNGAVFTAGTTFTTAQGDTLTVTLTSAVTGKSDVGVYPIVAAVTGPASANYVQPTSGNLYVVTTGPDSGTGAKNVSFWDNKSNAKLITTADLVGIAGAQPSLDQLNLKNANGSNFDPTTAAQLDAWLRSDTDHIVKALSIQLAVMDLNVLAGYVKTTDVVYAGNLLQFVGTAYSVTGLDGGGFISIGNLMTLANNALANYTSPSNGGNDHNPLNNYLDALEDALEAANNNQTFVHQAVPPGI